MKRFTDTEKWHRDPWFGELAPRYKLFWLYLVDTCDSVGVWEVNLRVANALIGAKYTLPELREAFAEKIYEFDGGRKWWVLTFIKFQHGELNPDSTSRPVQAFIKMLHKHGLWEVYTKGIDTLSIPYANGIDTLSDSGKSPQLIEAEAAAEQFERCWALYGCYGNKQTAKRYWLRLKQADRDGIEAAIPAYLEVVDHGRKKKEFQGWINPQNRLWAQDWRVAKDEWIRSDSGNNISRKARALL